MTTTPKTLTEVRQEIAARAVSARHASEASGDDTPTANPSHTRGVVQGWQSAVHAAALVSNAVHDSDTAALTALNQMLIDNHRMTRNLPPTDMSAAVREGNLRALIEAGSIVTAALSRHSTDPDPEPHPQPEPPPAPHPRDWAGPGRGPWAGYPKVPVKVVDDFHSLCLFLGGDTTSFTGDLLSLIGKSDPANLNKLATAFPHETRAYLMWRSLGPIPADTLLRLLEATHDLSAGGIQNLMRGGGTDV